MKKTPKKVMKPLKNSSKMNIVMLGDVRMDVKKKK